MGVTEIALLPLQDGKFPSDLTSEAGKVHRDSLDTLLSRPGVQRIYWGTQIENVQLLIWFVDWDSVDDHKKFMESESYKPFLNHFWSILGGGGKLYHARFSPFPPSAALSKATSPTTEIVTAWFPVSYSEEDQEEFSKNVQEFISVLQKEAKTYRASSGGWVDEEVDIPETHEKGKAYVLVIGWTSVEAHMEFRESHAFKDSIHYIMDARDLRKIEAAHSSLTEVKRS